MKRSFDSGSQPKISRFFASKGRLKNLESTSSDPAVSTHREEVICDVEAEGPLRKARLDTGHSAAVKALTRIREFSFEDNFNDPERISYHGCAEISRGDLPHPEPVRDREKRKLVKLLDAKTLRLKLTPLEEQVVEIKRQYPDTVLAVECGYKYRFFGEDAELVASVLSIFAHVDHNFLTCSFPTHRLLVHVKRLVSAGFKVGVVRQLETAALKAVSETRNAPFKRELSTLYSRATFIENEDSTEANVPPLCILFVCESLGRPDGTQQVGIVALKTQSGELCYDSFEDDRFRSKLDSVVTHLQPVEVVLPQNSISHLTRQFIENFAASRTAAGDCLRTEFVSDNVASYPEAFQLLQTQLGEPGSEEVLQKLPPVVVSCLAAACTYLKEYKLTHYLHDLASLKKYSAERDTLRMDATVLRNLELVPSGGQKPLQQPATLFDVLNKTRTRLGARLLRDWILKPLTNKKKIEARLDTVDWLIRNDEICDGVESIKKCLKKLPDLDKALISITQQRATPSEFYTSCTAWLSVYAAVVSAIEADSLESFPEDLRNVFQTILHTLDEVHLYLDQLNVEAVGSGEKTRLFSRSDQHPVLAARHDDIVQIERQLNDLRKTICKTLGFFGVNYVTVAGHEYLVEVKNDFVKAVPSSWLKISSTKSCGRFRPPEVQSLYLELCRARERLVLTAEEAWQQFLSSFASGNHLKHKRANEAIAVLDVLFSLAETSKFENFTRPEFVEEEGILDVNQGRHPVIAQILQKTGQQFVPNDTKFTDGGYRCMILSGPNMGGKSCYVRQVAIMVVMAQMGCYVPAESARLSVLDALFTRMGAQDEILSGRSTFLTEMSEASNILRHITSRSLVILDELGRGTGTHDGAALAYATLEHITRHVKCLTLFVTHYPEVMAMEKEYPTLIRNFHLGYLLQSCKEGEVDEDLVVFLYTLTEGPSPRSYGLNVAKMAGIPDKIIQRGKEKSRELEDTLKENRILIEEFRRLLSCSSQR